MHWATSQIPHVVHNVLSMIYEPAPVRVVTPAVGGGFGAKSGVHGEELMLGGLAAALQRPMRWTETRSESMQSLEHGRAQHHEITIGGTRDGDVQAYRLKIVQDAGAYPGFASIIPVLMTRTMAPSVYDIPKVECVTKSVVTNTTPVAAYRGAGRPEAVAAIERAMDLFALEIGARSGGGPAPEPGPTVLGADDVGHGRGLRRRRLRGRARRGARTRRIRRPPRRAAPPS